MTVHGGLCLGLRARRAATLEVGDFLKRQYSEFGVAIASSSGRFRYDAAAERGNSDQLGPQTCLQKEQR